MSKKVGIVGIGAIGTAVAKALQQGIDGFHLHAVCDTEKASFGELQCVDLETLIETSDLIVECLPAHIVPKLVEQVCAHHKDIIFISSAAFLLHPDLQDKIQATNINAYLPSGALAGLDGVRAMQEMGIINATIKTTKPPAGLHGAPYIEKNDIKLDLLSEKSIVFKGNALEASEGFPANVNVAATLSLAGIGAQKTQVEVWADPDAKGNSHEIIVESQYSTLTARIENMPDPNNPKSSVLAAQSIVSCLRNMSNAIKIG